MAFAATASRDGFSFAGDFFLVTVSGHVHRRCSIPELKAHFEALDHSKDRPGHWYEAQLLHYGLLPSKVKGTAKMRLLEAVNLGKMAVLAPLAALERELKQVYNTTNKKEATNTAESLAPAKATEAKRKAERVRVVTNVTVSNVCVSVTLNHEADSPSAKKAKTVAKSYLSKLPSINARTMVEPAQKPAREADSSACSDLKPKTDNLSTEQTALRDNARSGGQVKQEPSVKDEFGNDSLNDYPFEGHHDGGYFNTPLPLQPVPPLSTGFSNFYDRVPVLAPLGLINGRYEIYKIDDQDVPNDGSCWLVCTIDCDQLWILFDLGFLNGVMLTASRPRRPSLDPLQFSWCGQSQTSYKSYNASNQSFLAFVGDGFLDGTIGWNGHDLAFKARRLDGQSTRSEISAREMRAKWNTLYDG
ncbi:hypothetical protein CI238_12407 [Colletotrichum incanum]|uniref:Uncharacterized protein n=1 Tax=Colletotrichum incanum TaxID=1573173 RepID=A0A167B4R5_COLIC|nr:hypothetical protein CI238_12407 [Colletotrichum incanum]